MKKQDLKTGMRVELANGIIYIVLVGEFRCNNEKQGVLFCRPKGYMNDTAYTEDLECEVDEEFSIVKVYDLPKLTAKLLNPKKVGDLLWERCEETPEKTHEIDGVEYSESTLRSLIKKAVKNDE